MDQTPVDVRKYTVYSRKVIETAVINFTILVGVVLIFATGVRSKFKSVSTCYDVRRRLEKELEDYDVNQPPPKALNPLRVFFRSNALGQGLQLLRVAGLDGVVAARFAMMCFYFSILCSPVAVGLCFLYRNGPEPQGKADLQSLQLSNQRGPFVQFSAVVAAWWIACSLMFLLTIEYKQFTLFRLLYFTGEHLEDEAKGKRDYYARTVLVQGVPKWIHTHAELHAAFENLFGHNSVERAVLCTDASALRRAVRNHEELAKDGEALDLASRGDCLSLVDIAMKYGAVRLLRISRYTEETPETSLDEMLAGVHKVYENYLQAGESDLYEKRRPPELVLERSKSEENLIHDLRQHIAEHNRDAALGLPQISVPERIVNSQQRLSSLVQTVRDQGLISGEFAPLYKWGWTPVKGIYRGLSYVLGHKGTENAGFVTFKHRASQAVAVQMTLYQSSKSTITSRAPFPRDVIWENLCIPEAQVTVRAFFSLCMMLVALVLWSAVAALIQAIANLQFIHEWLKANFTEVTEALRIEAIFEWGEGQIWWTALNGFLPALALTMLLVVLPPLIRAWSRVYEGRKSRSAVMVDSVRVCFIFNLVTMYVTVFSGSFLQSGFLGSGNPVEVTVRVLQGIASKLDDVSGYLMCYIFTKLGVRMAVYLCRPYAALPWLLCTLFQTWTKKKGKRELLMSKGPTDGKAARQFLKEPPCYDWIITDLSIILALCTMYGIMSPVLLLVAIPFYWVYAAMVRYNVVFVYTQEYDSGGQLFFSLVDTTFTSLLLSLLLLQTYLVSIGESTTGVLNTLGFVFWHCSIPTLMVFILTVWRALHRRFKHVCSALSLQLAKELDSCPVSTEKEERVLYQDPVVSQARRLLGDARATKNVWQR